jgi:hypothetical protein
VAKGPPHWHSVHGRPVQGEVGRIGGVGAEPFTLIATPWVRSAASALTSSRVSLRDVGTFTWAPSQVMEWRLLTDGRIFFTRAARRMRMKDFWLLGFVGFCICGFIGMTAWESHASGRPFMTCLLTSECISEIAHSMR